MTPCLLRAVTSGCRTEEARPVENPVTAPLVVDPGLVVFRCAPVRASRSLLVTCRLAAISILSSTSASPGPSRDHHALKEAEAPGHPSGAQRT